MCGMEIKLLWGLVGGVRGAGTRAICRYCYLYTAMEQSSQVNYCTVLNKSDVALHSPFGNTWRSAGIYTVSQKTLKTSLLNISVNNQPILISFDTQNPENLNN